jgi:hypothetical protein
VSCCAAAPLQSQPHPRRRCCCCQGCAVGERGRWTHSHSVCVCNASEKMMRPDKKQSISCGRLTERHKREEKGKNHENAVSGDTQSHRRRRGPWKPIKSAGGQIGIRPRFKWRKGKWRKVKSEPVRVRRQRVMSDTLQLREETAGAQTLNGTAEQEKGGESPTMQMRRSWHCSRQKR